MGTLWQDIRYAVRLLAKARSLTLVVVLSLALGIGANATVVCWLRNMVLRPLPGVPRQDEIVVLVSNRGGGCASLPDLRDFGQLHEVFAGTEASMPTPASLGIGTQHEWIQAQIVTANFFELLGVRPILGRTFRPDEDQSPGGNPVLVISERLWQRRFSAAPDVVGRTIDLNRHSFTIIGVVPASFNGSLTPSVFDVWAPASMISEVRNQGRYFLTQRNARGWHNLARLQPGVSLSQAQAAVATRDASLAAAYPAENRDIHHRVAPLSQCPWGAQTVMASTLVLLLAVSLAVHLIVTANIANLLLAHAAGRSKEIAIRLAAGAGRLRLLRQFVSESLLLAILGGGLGILAAHWAVDAVFWLLPSEIAAGNVFEFNLDASAMAIAAILTLATGLVFGLAPWVQTGRMGLAETLKEGGRTSRSGASSHRLRTALVIAEVAIAVVLLVGARLCVKGLQQARRVEIGFHPDHVLTAGMQIGMNGYDEERGITFYRQLRRRLADLPGVEEAALASWFPLGLSGCKGTEVLAEGYTRPPGEDVTCEFAIVSPRYFATLQIPLVSGRDFTDADGAGTTPVAIINEHLARRFWPGRDPLGRRFRAAGTWRTVVGVAKAGKYNRLDEPAWCFFYQPDQQGVPDLDLAICIRTQGPADAFAGTLRQAVQQVDPGVDVRQTLPLAVYSSMVLFPQRVASSLLTLLSGVAMWVAMMGVYAVMAYSVGQQTHDFGVRLALGARGSDILRKVVGHGLAMAAAGAGIGLAIAAVLARWMTAFLYGVSPFDPVTFVLVPSCLVLVALLACWLPAWRASRVDPMTALRCE